MSWWTNRWCLPFMTYEMLRCFTSYRSSISADWQGRSTGCSFQPSIKQHQWPFNEAVFFFIWWLDWKCEGVNELRASMHFYLHQMNGRRHVTIPGQRNHHSWSWHIGIYSGVYLHKSHCWQLMMYEGLEELFHFITGDFSHFPFVTLFWGLGKKLEMVWSLDLRTKFHPPGATSVEKNVVDQLANRVTCRAACCKKKQPKKQFYQFY